MFVYVGLIEKEGYYVVYQQLSLWLRVREEQNLTGGYDSNEDHVFKTFWK
jgi:hypothetical protein